MNDSVAVDPKNQFLMVDPTAAAAAELRARLTSE